MHWIVLVILMLILLTALFLRPGGERSGRSSSGWSSQGESEKDPLGEVRLIAEDFAFRPHSVRGKRGETLTLFIESRGEHTFVLKPFGIRKELEPGMSVVFLVPRKAGSFRFYCDRPGHEKRGMFGTLTVE